jgi:D-3-phosphoglycerate dehydrogenase
MNGRKIKVLANDGMDNEGIEILEAAGIEVEDDKRSDAELIANIKDFDGLTVRSATKVTKEIIEAGFDSGKGRLRVIGRAGVGYDNIDVKSATEYGIVVKYAPFGNTISTAELSLFLMGAVARKIAKADNSMHSGKWEKSKFSGSELSHKTLGIIGCGRIGKKLSELVSGFNMNVLGYDPVQDPEAKIKYVALDQLLKESDFIAVHTGGKEEIIGWGEIGLMKPTAIIINAARAKNINQEALYISLSQKRIAGAGIDVHINEPKNKGDSFETKLKGLENVVLTPHLGASTKEAQIKTSMEMASVIRDYLLHNDFKNAVNVGEHIEYEGTPTYNLFVHHQDVPGAFAKISGVLADAGINIRENPSRGLNKGFAVTTFCLHSAPGDDVLKKIKDLEIVKRVIY